MDKLGKASFKENLNQINVYDLKFAKQFVFSKDDLTDKLPKNWEKKQVFLRYNLFLHPWIKYHAGRKNNIEIHLIGEALWAEYPQYQNSNIVEDLVNKVSTFEEIENCINYFSGRWIIFVYISGASRIYHDAAGLKPVYFIPEESGNITAASQPSLLEIVGKTTSDVGLREKVGSVSDAGYWPPQVIPYRNVVQLLPNHYLNVESCKAQRYWCKSVNQELSREDIVNQMFSLIESFMEAVSARYKLVVPLTGGYDSRLLLAASKRFWPVTEFVTIRRPDIPRHDISIANKIAQSFDLNYTYLKENEDSELNRILLSNVGEMHYDYSAHYMNTGWMKIGAGKAVVPGTGGEMLRRFFIPQENSSAKGKKICAVELLKLLGFKLEIPTAINRIDEWLEEFPQEFSSHLLDYAYWELRLGIRFAIGQTLREGILDEFPVLNCRHLFDLGLATSIEDRTRPYPLFQDLVRRGDPLLLNIPFNYCWVDMINEKTRGIPLLWRTQKLLR